MKANELRIGNLIHVDNHIAKVVSINELGITPSIIERASQCTNLGSKSPIPLTEEWLIRFGFKFGINLQDFVKGKHQFVEFGTFNGYFFEKGILYFGINTKIRYVHQLQNLYFALTGEELTLKK